jgi:hypothetical protein
MLKRRAYCSQIGWVRQVFIAHKLQIKSSRWTKNNLYRLNNESFVFVIFGEQLIFKAITAIDEGMGSPVDVLSDRELEVSGETRQRPDNA